ncbi:hypothetical protein [uncultured Desulfovibrio sp.]|uniref:hypothetical protein n=1 Tax=uncultured Desulfovibrio sp. TaxID=167968 RepID=UPI00261F88FA|nr:hypothetical protein [uncultured Desulfovibrio sp.]
MKTALCWLVAALLFSGLLGRLAWVNRELEAERAAHAATARERDRWEAAAEAYRKDAEAQAENARQCLGREAKAARDAAEREDIMRQAKPRARTAEEKVVDDETRRRAVERLNRGL